ncbi:hypothetical protein KEM54_003878 [Ascosphaera aggregata]|nr:hypothetical protein KEM54_003878 [Ascosphaera aggregata]
MLNSANLRNGHLDSRPEMRREVEDRLHAIFQRFASIESACFQRVFYGWPDLLNACAFHNHSDITDPIVPSDDDHQCPYTAHYYPLLGFEPTDLAYETWRIFDEYERAQSRRPSYWTNGSANGLSIGEAPCHEDCCAGQLLQIDAQGSASAAEPEPLYSGQVASIEQLPDGLPSISQWDQPPQEGGSPGVSPTLRPSSPAHVRVTGEDNGLPVSNAMEGTTQQMVLYNQTLTEQPVSQLPTVCMHTEGNIETAGTSESTLVQQPPQAANDGGTVPPTSANWGNLEPLVPSAPIGQPSGIFTEMLTSLPSAGVHIPRRRHADEDQSTTGSPSGATSSRNDGDRAPKRRRRKGNKSNDQTPPES